MPSFDQTTVTDAAPEDVWKLLYDPARFPDWWAGVESVELADHGYTMYPEGYPDFPMPQALTASAQAGVVRVSCLVSDLAFAWRLRPYGTGTEISVHVEIPETEAHRLDTQRDIIGRSLLRLAAVAELEG
jgi:hypothetical protein